jgi:hypothetical protein
VAFEAMESQAYSEAGGSELLTTPSAQLTRIVIGSNYISRLDPLICDSRIPFLQGHSLNDWSR